MSVTVASSSLEIHHPHLMQAEGLVPTGTRAAPARPCPAHRCRPLAVPVRFSPCTPEKASVVRERMDWASSGAQRNSSVCSARETRGRSAVVFWCRK